MEQKAVDSAFVTHHNITIRGLESGRTYYFEVVSADTSGNKAKKGEYKFKTRSSMPVTVVIGERILRMHGSQSIYTSEIMAGIHGYTSEIPLMVLVEA